MRHPSQTGIVSIVFILVFELCRISDFRQPECKFVNKTHKLKGKCSKKVFPEIGLAFLQIFCMSRPTGQNWLANCDLLNQFLVLNFASQPVLWFRKQGENNRFILVWTLANSTNRKCGPVYLRRFLLSCRVTILNKDGNSGKYPNLSKTVRYSFHGFVAKYLKPLLAQKIMNTFL